MAEQRVAYMTLDELKALIDQQINKALHPRDLSHLEEIFALIDANMWTPPPGAKSTLELLREDKSVR